MKAWEQTEQQKRTNQIKQLIHKTNKQATKQKVLISILSKYTKTKYKTPHKKITEKGKIENGIKQIKKYFNREQNFFFKSHKEKKGK